MSYLIQAVLSNIQGTLVNVDQLDYLAKRLDSFCAGEVSQFQAMAHKLEMAYIRDFINLTFCCQQATVITDFSDLEAVGRTHHLNMSGGCCAADELANLDGTETALLLIDGGGGIITPYGVVYDNGMVLEQCYNGRQFPTYPYDSTLMVLEVTPKRGLAEGDSPEYLYLPASERQIERTLLRVGITELHEAQVRLDFDELPEKAAEALDLEHLSGDDLPALNRMCRAIASLNEADQEKLNQLAEAIDGMNEAGYYHLSKALNTEPRQSLDEVLRTAAHIKPSGMDCYEIIPEVTTHQALGKWLVEHDHLEETVPESLQPYLDYRSIGVDYCNTHEGEFLSTGYAGIRMGAAEQVLEEQGILHLTLATAESWYYLTLPASEAQLERVKRALEIENFAQAGIAAVRCSSPHLDGLLPLDAASVEDANTLALYLQEMEQEDGGMMKFCAVLEVEQPDTFTEAVSIAMDRDDYEQVPEDMDEYGKQVLRRFGADDEVIDTIDGYMDFAQLGLDSMAEDGVRRTEFGLIRRLSTPFPPEQGFGPLMS